MTASRGPAASGGMLGVAIAMKEGSTIKREHNITDPAVPLAQDVAEILAKIRGASVADTALSVPRGNLLLPNPNALSDAAPGAAYVIDIDSGWGYEAYPKMLPGTMHYYSKFSAQLRVIDTASRKVVAHSQCRWRSDSKDAPSQTTREELVADDAKIIKAALAAGVDACREQFRAEVMKTLGAPG